MRIEAYTQVQQLYRTNQVKKPQKANSASFSDQLQISSLGKDIQTAKAAVAAAPDVRTDKVANLKAQVQNGTYNVSNESFAEKLLQKYDEMR